jgi:DNA-binding transcriptional LysR family regulator
MQSLGMPVDRTVFPVRTDDQVAYARLVEAGAGIGFLTQYSASCLTGVVPILPQLRIAPLPCWLVVHREIRASPLIRRTYDFLAAAIPGELG